MTIKQQFDLIPEESMEDIRCLMGDEYACAEIINDILERHGYEGEGFLVIEPEEDMELVVDIYNELFNEGA